MKYNKQGLEKKIKNFRELKNSKVTYGIFGEKANQPANNKITIGHLARIHEEGRTYKHSGGRIKITSRSGEEKWIFIKAGTTITIPSRPFFLHSHWILYEKLPKIIKRQIKLLINGNNSVDNMLKQIGEFCKATVKKSIETGNFSPLSTLQVWYKGHDKALQDTIKMYSSIDYEIKKK